MKADADIQKDVMEELRWAPYLKPSSIGVSVTNGVVTLSGTVDSYKQKIEAEKTLRKVEGVKAVAEDIEVRLASFGKRSDTELAEAVVNALKWRSSLNEEKINVKVENGWVTLQGEVEREFHRKEAHNAIVDLIGVVGINNNIKLKPKVEPVDIKQKITAALHRSARLNAEKITVTYENNKVILAGKVHCYTEKKDAENAAWQAPGVIAVENRIEVDNEIQTSL